MYVCPRLQARQLVDRPFAALLFCFWQLFIDFLELYLFPALGSTPHIVLMDNAGYHKTAVCNNSISFFAWLDLLVPIR